MMLNRSVRRRLALGVCLACVGLAPSVTLGQGTTGNRNEPAAAPIATTARTGDTNWLTLGCVFLLAIGVLAVNFMPSKRGHQD